jgi:hypothetical protein
MHTVELLDEALAAAKRLGYRLRQEWLGGAGGGACEIAGQKWLFIDLSLGPAEQLDTLAAALREETAADLLPLSPGLRRIVEVRRAA